MLKLDETGWDLTQYVRILSKARQAMGKRCAVTQEFLFLTLKP